MNICIYQHTSQSGVEVTNVLLAAYQRAFENLGHPVLVLSHDALHENPDSSGRIARSEID